MELKMGYCPICNINIGKSTDDTMIKCPRCGHHINVKPALAYVAEDIKIEKETEKNLITPGQDRTI